MIVKTKKTQLNQKDFIKMAFENLVKSFWWALLIPVAWCMFYFLAPSKWWFITGGILLVLLVGLTILLLYSVTKNEQFAMLFQKVSYHIDSRSLTIMLNPKQGSPIQWNQIQRAEEKDNSFILYMNRVTMISLPEKAFNSQNDIKFTRLLLTKKGLLK